MRSGILAILVVVALSVCVIAAERPEPFSPGDILIVSSAEPNDPNGAVPPAGDPNKVWDPATHLAADWESIAVSMTSRLYNPARQPDAKVQGPQWSMSVAAVVDIIDSNGLIGWSPMPASVLALDQDGAVVTSSTSGSPMLRWYQQPSSWSLPPGFPSEMFRNQFSLNLPVDPNATYPEAFSRVEWTMNVLVAEEVKTVDVPFKASDTWVELTPGMEVLVEQATVEQSKYQYRIKLKYDRTRVEYLMGGSIHLWADQQLPGAAVIKVGLFDAGGKLIQNLGGGFGASGSDNQMTDTASGSGTCAACGTAATLRYTLTFGLYEQEVRFALENIPVPEF